LSNKSQLLIGNTRGKQHEILTSISDESSQEDRRDSAETLASIGCVEVSEDDFARRRFGMTKSSMAYVPLRDVPPRAVTMNGFLDLNGHGCQRVFHQHLLRSGPYGSHIFPRQNFTSQTHLPGYDSRPAFIAHCQQTGSLSAMLAHARARSCQVESSNIADQTPFVSQPMNVSRESLAAQEHSMQMQSGAAAASAQSSATAVAQNSVKICAMQPVMRKPHQSRMEATQQVLQMMNDIAAREKVDLFILPELCPVGYSEDTFRNFLPVTPKMQSLYHQIDFEFATQACKLEAYISYGTIGWKTRDDGSFRCVMRQVVLDRSGAVVASYDKSRLSDHGLCAETRYFDKGTVEPPVFSINGLKFGVLFSSDMHCPMVCNSMVRDKKADVLVQPASITRDSCLSLRTWKSFCETRAVENSVYVVGVNYGGEGYGETAIIPPWIDDEHEPISLGDINGRYLIGKIEQGVIHDARSTKPFCRRFGGERKVTLGIPVSDGESFCMYNT